MATITHTRGMTVGEPLTLTDDQDQPLDLTGCTVTAHVQVGGECRELVATITDALIGEAWLDWEALDLGPRVYRVTISVTWPDGAEETAPGYIALYIKEPC